MDARNWIFVPEQVSLNQFKLFRDFGLREVMIAAGLIVFGLAVFISPLDFGTRILVLAIVGAPALAFMRLRIRDYTPERFIGIIFDYLSAPKIFIHRQAYAVSHKRAVTVEEILPDAPPAPQPAPKPAPTPKPEPKPKAKPKKHDTVRAVPKAQARPVWTWPTATIWGLVAMTVVIAFMAAVYINLGTLLTITPDLLP